jgi:hypothetical protein
MGRDAVTGRRWRPTAAIAVGGALAATLLASCAASPPPRHSSATTTTTPPSTSTAPTTTTSTTTTDPGLLPQTATEPPVDASLQTTLAPLWAAIVSGSASQALGVFFPESAYLQMKTGVLPDPSSDFTGRLIAFYDLDIAAYHQALGTGASGATLLSVNAAAADAAYIPPGACENRIGYWHLPGVRLVYRDNGTEQSFAVASLISWRGQWYVVHLGPNPRPENVGTVDQPSAGPGVVGPPGGC